MVAPQYPGCSLIISSQSMVCKKPISMQYNNFIGKCCQNLAKTEIAPADGDLVHFISLQRLAEEISSTFGYNLSHNEGAHINVENIELLVNAFISRLHDVRSSFPSNSRCLCEYSNY